VFGGIETLDDKSILKKISYKKKQWRPPSKKKKERKKDDKSISLLRCGMKKYRTQ
jgi:hypothetical protein